MRTAGIAIGSGRLTVKRRHEGKGGWPPGEKELALESDQNRGEGLVEGEKGC